jgi:hypothetical protein
MGTPGTVAADIAGMRGMSGEVSIIADELAKLVRIIDRVPEPTAAGYGWEPTAQAMRRLLSAWSLELDLVRQTCAELDGGIQRNALELEILELRQEGEFRDLGNLVA